jgi:hypothetical protein
MSTKKTQGVTSPEDILRDYSLEIQAIAEELRRLVKLQVPNAVEQGYPRWRGIGYRHPSAGYFCGIFPQQDEVHLLFEWGILLPDPQGILQGEGKQVRYVVIKSIATIDRSAVAALFVAALALPDSSAAKKQMINNLDRGI